jgi:hypothetical protein
MMEAYSAGASSQTKCPASMIARRLVGSRSSRNCVGERDDSVVAAVNDRDRGSDVRQQLGECGQLLGASVAHIGANA